MSDFQRFELLDHEGVAVVRLLDRELSDLLVQDEFYNELMSIVDSQRPEKVLIDFEVVQYCNTGIINTLITANKRINDGGGRMVLCCLSQHVHDAFKALNLEHTVFNVYATRDEALASFD